MEKDKKSCEVELSSMSTQSPASSNSKSSNDGVSKESTRTVIPSHSRKRQKVTRSQDPKRLSGIERLKELLLKTGARLSEDGKSIECLLCGKSPKLDKCKRSAEGHIKYFNRVHSCTTKTTDLETSQAKMKDYQTVIIVMQPTRLGRTRRLTQRMINYVQS